MRYWYDTEFIEDGSTIDLISIGMVSEDGRELYLQNLDCRLERANDWVKENVISHLSNLAFYQRSKTWIAGGIAEAEPWGDWRLRVMIRDELIKFVSTDIPSKPQFWGYYADYDHVVLCQVFGRMIDLPKGWPMYTRDIKQWCDDLGNPELPQQGKGEHHALADARWNREAWLFLEQFEAGENHK